MSDQTIVDSSGPRPESGPAIGSRIRYFGDYELLEEIARGGMGVVYKARQTRLNRIVALKMILTGQLAGEAEIQRFLNEAKSAANLKHDNIVTIHEIGQHEGQYFFSMDYVDGRGLDAVISGDPVPAKQAAEWLKTLAEALHYAHANGVLHRDLKPSNIMVDGAGRLHITDFGLAKQMNDDSGLTRTGTVLGTPAYMPPEQARGDRTAASPASDVYSLGAILYELLTRRPPFWADTPLDTVMQVLHREPVTPRILAPKLDRDLETICLKCLDKDPKRRYASARELADDLGRYLNLEPIRARPVNALTRSWRWTRRNPWKTVALGTLIAFTLVSAGAVMKLRSRLWESLLAQARAERLAGNPLRALELIREAAGIRKDVRVRREAIETVSQPGALLIRRFYFGSVDNLAFSADDRFIAIAGDRRFDDNAPPRENTIAAYATATGEFVSETAGSEQGRDLIRHPSRPWFLLARNTWKWVDDGGGRSHREDYLLDDRMVAWDPATGREETNLSAPPTTGKVSLQPWLVSSRDGRLIARMASRESGSESRRAVEVWDLETKKLYSLPAERTSCGFDDQNRLVVCREDGFATVDPATGAMVASCPVGDSAGMVVPALVSENGRLGVAVEYQISIDDPEHAGNDVPHPVRLRLYDPAAGRELGQPIEYAADVHNWEVGFDNLIRISPDGKRIAIRHPADSATIRVYEVGNPGRVTILAEDPVRVLFEYSWHWRPAEFSPDGTLLAVTGRENAHDKVWVYDLLTGNRVAVLADQNMARFSADGTLLATSGAGTVQTEKNVSRFEHNGIIHLWRLTLPPASERLPVAVRNLTFSPDGKRVAVNGLVRGLVSTGNRLTLAPAPVTATGAAAFYLPNGTLWTGPGAPGVNYSLYSADFPLRFSRIEPDPRTVELAAADYPVTVTPPDRIVPDPTALGISPDGSFAFISEKLWRKSPGGGGNGLNGVLERWDLGTGRREKIFAGEDNDYRTIAVSPDGTRLALKAYTNEVECRDAVTGTQSWKAWTPQQADILAFSPDGRQLYAGGNQTNMPGDQGGIITIHDAETGKIERQLAGHTDGIRALAVSSDGTMLASGGLDRTIWLWDARTGEALATWQAGESGITALAFSPDGNLLAIGAEDGTFSLRAIPPLRAALRELGLDW